MGLYKVIKILAFVLAIVGAVFMLMIMTGNEAMIDNMLAVTYVTLGLVIAFVLLFVVKGFFEGNIKKTLLTLGAFLAIIGVSYALSSGTDLNLKPFTDKGVDITEGDSKMVGAGLIAFYILAFLAIVSMAFSGIKGLFNK